MTAVEKVDAFIVRMNQAESDAERSRIETDMLHYCYFLPKADWLDVQPQLDPFMEKIRQEILPNDPVLQRAEELLNRRKAVLQ